MHKGILGLVLFSCILTACSAGQKTSLPPTSTVPKEPTSSPAAVEPSQTPLEGLVTTPGETTPSSTSVPQPTPIPPTPTVQARVPVGPLMIEGLQAIQLVGDPQAGDSFYALTPAGLYITRDGGLTWAQVTPTPLQDNFVFSPAEPGILYAGSGPECYHEGLDQPLLKSVNGGATWSEMAGATNLHPVVVHPADPNRLWAIGCTGPAYSSDGGATWQVSEHELFLTYEASQILPVDDNWSTVYVGGASEEGVGMLARSRDGGQSWSPLLQGAPDGSGPLWWVNDLAVSPDQILLIDPHGVWRSRDDGSTWAFFTAGLEGVVYQDGADLASTGLNALLLDTGTIPPTIYMGTMRGVYKSRDDGETWTKFEPQGEADWTDSHVRDIARSTGSPGAQPRLFVTTDQGVYVTQP